MGRCGLARFAPTPRLLPGLFLQVKARSQFLAVIEGVQEGGRGGLDQMVQARHKGLFW